MIGIYKITNPEGKVYVGKSNYIEGRFYSHRRVVESCGKLKISFELYGVENHVFEVIEECSEEILNIREMHWMNKYSSVKHGLNTIQSRGGITMRGKMRFSVTREEKNKLKEQARNLGMTLNSYCKHIILNL